MKKTHYYNRVANCCLDAITQSDYYLKWQWSTWLGVFCLHNNQVSFLNFLCFSHSHRIYIFFPLHYFVDHVFQSFNIFYYVCCIYGVNGFYVSRLLHLEAKTAHDILKMKMKMSSVRSYQFLNWLEYLISIKIERRKSRASSCLTAHIKNINSEVIVWTFILWFIYFNVVINPITQCHYFL